MGCLDKRRSIMNKVPSTCRDVIEHKWSRSDTPKKVASTYQIGSFDRIWNTRSNDKLRKTRGVPEALQVGDVVAIPFAEKDLKTLVQKASEYNAMSKNFYEYVSIVARKVIKIEKQIAAMDKQITTLVRKKYDQSKEAQLAKDVAKSASGLNAIIQSIPESKDPFAAQLKLSALFREALVGKKASQNLSPGKDFDKQLKKIEKIISNKKAEIKVLKDRLKTLEAELKQEGLHVIVEICTVKTLQRLGPMLKKDFL